ncbi:hypothetical protein EMCRGX_G013740 [Ephydatia muelleri]
MHECHWLNVPPVASCTTPLSGLVEMALFSSSAACLSSSGQQRSIPFDAGLTRDGSSSEATGTAHSTRCCYALCEALGAYQ